MSEHTITAPAKTNLTLRVLGKMGDGFHDLESLMVPLDLADVLRFEKADQYQFCCDATGVPCDESNLVTRAVRVFERETGMTCRWKMTLEKHIPHGAGLGGGSSDAASALLMLNKLENANIPVQRLAAMGAEIGSDIPFFMHQTACVIRGRGEIVEPVHRPELKGLNLLLLKPAFGVSTPDAYRNCLDADCLYGIDYAPQKMPWGDIVNDLEKPVFFKHRFLAEMKMWLLDQVEVDAALMSGSGSTMIAFVKDACAEMIAERACVELDPTLWTQPVTIHW